jgi:cytoskeleton protein RodZ
MSIGQVLRDARISRGLSLEDIADKTKIRVTLLKYIEADEFEKVGAPTYARGHIAAYAKLMNIDAVELLKGFVSTGDTPLDKVVNQRISSNPEAALDNKFDLEKISLNAREIKTNSGFNWTSLMVTALALVLVVGVFSFVTRVNQETVIPPIADVSEVFEEENVEATTPARTPNDDEENLTASNGGDLVLLVLNAVDGASWVRASNLDDETIFEGTIRNGESQTISNLDEVKLLVGNAGALNVSLNGQVFGKIGGNGEVKRCSVTFTTLECN